MILIAIENTFDLSTGNIYNMRAGWRSGISLGSTLGVLAGNGK